MERLYLVSTDLLRDAELEQAIYQRCSDMRRAKADLCRTDEKRRQSLAASCLLDCALRKIGLQERNVRYQTGEKPSIMGLSDFRFSLSHSGNWAICAVSDREIGADVEMPREFSPRLLQRYFTEQERTDPLRVWVLKESFCKLTGVGIREIPTLEAELRDPVSMLQHGKQTAVRFWEENLPDGARIAVCRTGSEPIQMEEIIVNRSDLI